MAESDSTFSPSSSGPPMTPARGDTSAGRGNTPGRGVTTPGRGGGQRIYVPTTTAHKNLKFLQNLSPTAVWSNATASVQSPHSDMPKKQYQAPKLGLEFRKANQYQPIDLTSDKSETTQFDRDKKILNDPGSTPVLLSDDTATATSASQTLGSNHRKFSEIEAHIRTHNQSIKNHQAEFKKVNQRFDLLESRVMTTLEFCRDSSNNVMELREETTNHILGLRS